MNTYIIKIIFKDDTYIISDNVINFMTSYNNVFNVYFVNGRESYILSDISKIEIIYLGKE